tara:strand:+ start:1716 stop:2147 length:432 start_codon:yes stop_codon:yes gene_type:complete
MRGFKMTYISSPLIRSFIGFDNLFDEINKLSDYKESNYPAYNIEKVNENNYHITLAVAGFKAENIIIEFKPGLLTIEARSMNSEEDVEYLHKGIAQRAFVKQFRIENNIEVQKAELENGILKINLRRLIPEEKSAVRIKIKTL